MVKTIKISGRKNMRRKGDISRKNTRKKGINRKNTRRKNTRRKNNSRKNTRRKNNSIKNTRMKDKLINNMNNNIKYIERLKVIKGGDVCWENTHNKYGIFVDKLGCGSYGGVFKVKPIISEKSEIDWRGTTYAAADRSSHIEKLHKEKYNLLEEQARLLAKKYDEKRVRERYKIESDSAAMHGPRLPNLKKKIDILEDIIQSNRDKELSQKKKDIIDFISGNLNNSPCTSISSDTRKNNCKIEFGETVVDSKYIPRYYALKVSKYPKPEYKDEYNLTMLFREAYILKHLSGHPSIPTLYFEPQIKRVDTEKRNMYLGMELVNMSLHDAMKTSFKVFDNRHLYTIAYGLLSGIDFLHNNDVIHRDLKPQNIGINSDLSIKILDFGLSTVIYDEAYQSIPSSWFGSEKRDLPKKYNLTGICYTQYWRSPECCVIMGNCDNTKKVPIPKYDKSADIWAMGCILIELLWIHDSSNYSLIKDIGNTDSKVSEFFTLIDCALFTNTIHGEPKIKFDGLGPRVYPQSGRLSHIEEHLNRCLLKYNKHFKNHYENIKEYIDTYTYPDKESNSSPERLKKFLLKNADSTGQENRTCNKSRIRLRNVFNDESINEYLDLCANLLHFEPSKRYTSADGLTKLKGFYVPTKEIPTEKKSNNTNFVKAMLDSNYANTVTTSKYSYNFATDNNERFTNKGGENFTYYGPYEITDGVVDRCIEKFKDNIGVINKDNIELTDNSVAEVYTEADDGVQDEQFYRSDFAGSILSGTARLAEDSKDHSIGVRLDKKRKSPPQGASPSNLRVRERVPLLPEEQVSDWEKRYSRKDGESYWYNKRTNTAQWENPGIKEDEFSEEVLKSALEANTIEELTKIEELGRNDKEMPHGTIIDVEGYGTGVYLGFEKNTLGANEHIIKFEDMDPIKVKLKEIGWSLATMVEISSLKRELKTKSGLLKAMMENGDGGDNTTILEGEIHELTRRIEELEKKITKLKAGIS